MYVDALGLKSVLGLRLRKTVRPLLGAAIAKMPSVFNQRQEREYQQ